MTNINASLLDPCYEPLGYGWEQALAKPSRQLFAENLNRLMTHRRIKNAALATYMEVSRTTVGRWRDGDAEPGFEEKDEIAQFLGVPVSEFYIDPTDSRSTGIELERALRMVAEAIEKMI